MPRLLPHIDQYRANRTTQEILEHFVGAANRGTLDSGWPWSPDGLLHRYSAGRDEVSSVMMMYCATQCARADYPLWKIDLDLVDALLRTEPPAWEVPKLPYPGLYLEIPKGRWQVQNDETGDHDVIGMYIAEARLVDPIHQGEDFTTVPWHDGFILIVVGEVRSVRRTSALVVTSGSVVKKDMDDFDDALIYLAVGPGGPRDDQATWPEGIRLAWVFAQNLLYALRTKNLEALTVKPTKNPKSPGKQKRLERQGKLRTYSVLQLTQKVKDHARKPVAEAAESVKRSAHIRMAHWAHYWTLKKEDGHVAVEERTGKPPLYKVARWIPMVRVGQGTGHRPEVRLR